MSLRTLSVGGPSTPRLFVAGAVMEPDYTFVGMMEPYCPSLPNLPVKTPSPDSYLRLLDTVLPPPEVPLSSSFQIAANSIRKNQTHICKLHSSCSCYTSKSD
ncbi:hypothetical protein ZOSMA_57G00210 [Zostera marina]|uniref:Uncharacterized protein n=1 Tax=Zostera marina TaxID=29655 RepID=A0A0K9NVB4_ZOSMR|nr:hypothetical protein ZOSMA_57G00210 [Zostera marina]